jgi:ribosomal protein L12E/L44/L45/RPP1/RPP2
VRLSDKEQRHVRTAIRFLRFKVGGWAPLADALGLRADSLVKIVNARGRDVTARLAYNVARLTDVSIDDLLSGALLSPRTCPHCGRAPDESEFVDEETVVDEANRHPKRDADNKRHEEFAEIDFEGPFERGHAVFDDAYGVYLLVGVVEDEPAKLLVVYVGRGHFRRQLAAHASNGRARHFFVKRFPTASKAFREECRLFHKYGAFRYLDNETHPAVPAGSPANTPMCYVRGCRGARD